MLKLSRTFLTRLHQVPMLYFILLSLVLGTYFAYYYLYRHRAQQTCRAACDCEAINFEITSNPLPIQERCTVV